MKENKSEWVLLRSFSNSLEANIVCSFLNSQGIETQSRDEHIVNINWLYSNAVGGVKVMVRSQDLEAATSALEAQESAPPLEVVGEECPKCHSTQTEHNFKSYKGIKTLFVALFALVLPFRDREAWSCLSCGHQWQKTESQSGIYIFFNWLIFFLVLGLLLSLFMGWFRQI
ncbi:MAG: DUF2007 domain-containing protein [Bdellovibrionales bacterium]|nr:DUF2007 domain-containing protein [Bdellovibrionales bacterium]